LDVFVLKASLDRDIVFMTELVLERAIITPTLIQTLLLENQMKMLLTLITRPSRPLYNPPSFSTIRIKAE